MSRLATELTRLLNAHSAENDSGTADFILAEYLIGCLNAFNAAVVHRDQWYGMRPEPGVSTGRMSSDKPNVEEVKRKVVISGVMTSVPTEDFIAQVEKDYSTKPVGVYRHPDNERIVIGVGLPDEPNVMGIPQALFDEITKDAGTIVDFRKTPSLDDILNDILGSRRSEPSISDLITSLRHRGNRGK